MIRQYLSQTNESATVSVLQKFFELNKALPNRGQSVLVLQHDWMDQGCNVFSFRPVVLITKSFLHRIIVVVYHFISSESQTKDRTLGLLTNRDRVW